MSQQRYSFPILKISHIIECAQELEVDLQVSDLKKPDADRMKQIYEQFVFILMGLSKEDMKQPRFEAIHVLQFPELHEDSIAETQMAKCILKLFRAVGVFDATMRDFCAPTPQRTKRILSAVINFAKFREERLQTYQELSAQTDELLDLKQQLETQHDQLTQQLDELRTIAEVEKPRIAGVEAENEELQKSIDRENHDHNSRKQEVSMMKEEIRDYDAKIANNKFTLLNTMQEIDRLKSQIVHSPEKLKAAIESMTEAAEVGRRDVVDCERDLVQLVAKRDALVRGRDKLLRRIANADECQEEITKCKELHKELKTVTTSIEADQETIRNMSKQEQHLRKQVSSGQDKLYRLQRQFEQKRHAAQMALDQMQAQKMAVERSNAKEKAATDHNQAMIDRKRAEIEQMKATHEQQCSLIRTQYQELATRVKEYHEKIFKATATPLSMRA